MIVKLSRKPTVLESPKALQEKKGHEWKKNNSELLEKKKQYKAGAWCTAVRYAAQPCVFHTWDRPWFTDALSLKIPSQADLDIHKHQDN